MRPAHSLAAATPHGRLQTLEALRDRLAAEVDACESARDIAALSQRVMDVLLQIESLSQGVKPEGTPLDELANRRAALDHGAGRPARAARKSK